METLSEQQQPQEGHDEKHGDYVVRFFYYAFDSFRYNPHGLLASPF